MVLKSELHLMQIYLFSVFLFLIISSVLLNQNYISKHLPPLQSPLEETFNSHFLSPSKLECCNINLTQENGTLRWLLFFCFAKFGTKHNSCTCLQRSLIPTLGTCLQSRKFYLTWIDLVWWQSKKLIKTCYQQLCNNTFKQNLARVGGSGGKKVCLIWSFIKFNYQGSWYLR